MLTSRQTRLQLRLENDEAKCKNCRNWRPSHHAYVGLCTVIHWEPASDNLPERAPIGKFAPVTTDLTVCSQWDAKD